MTEAVETPELGEFLRVAVEAARALAEHHASRGIHAAPTPEWLPAPASRRSFDAWAYNAPERTGRLQRPVDARSDLYALGVALYEALTEELPFSASDPLEWSHRHLAVPPRAPRELDPTIPETIERIVLTLLEKNPDDRYQTAAGLQRDLEHCLAQWEDSRAIAPFALRARDRLDRLEIPEKLYDRLQELGLLLEAFAAARAQTGPRVVVISGEAGLGKSALVGELAMPVAAAGGWFAQGEFENPSPGVLYGAIASAFGELITLILAGSAESLVTWRERLRAAVGIDARMLADVLPQLELLLGPLPVIARLPPTEAHFRFGAAFRRFVGVFATPAHPLVLVLDDVQWADPESLRLIVDLAADQSMTALLLILTYRSEATDSEVRSGLVDELRSAGTHVQTLALGPLGPDPLSRLLADALETTLGECEALHTSLYSRSAGNPLLFTQLLRQLWHDGLIRLDHDTMRWSWSAAALESNGTRDGTIEVLERRLDGCPEEVRRALNLAACVGGRFDRSLLAALTSAEGESMAAALDLAVDAGLLTRLVGGYRFTHDRIREVAYTSMPADDRPRAHRQIGQALIAAGGDLAEAVAQLDLGQAAIELAEERLELARLNLLAAERAHGAAAFDRVAEYCSAGLELLGEQAWSRERELAFELTVRRADAELFAGNLDAAAPLVTAAIENARTRLDLTRCAALRLDLAVASGDVVGGLMFVLDVLQSHGLNLSLPPENVEDAERALQERLDAFGDAALFELPGGEDPEIDALLDLLARAAPQSSFVDRGLFQLLICTVVDLTLSHGAYAASAWGFAAWSFARMVTGDYTAAERFAQLALTLRERHGFVRWQAGIALLLSAGVWTRSIAGAAELARDGARIGMVTGELHNAAVCWVLLCLERLLAGEPLDEIELDAEEGLGVAKRVHLAGEAANLVLIRQLVRALRGHTHRLDALTDPYVDAAALNDTLERNAASGLHWWWRTYILELQVLAGDFAGALHTRTLLDPDLPFMRGVPLVVDAEFFGALAVAGSDPATRARHLDRLRDAVARFEEWARARPENFGARAALLAGELARAEGWPDEARECFATAVARSQAAQFLHVEALAHESAARLCRELGRDRQAARHLHTAIACYWEWGAIGKARQLEHASGPPAAGSEVGEPQVDALAVVRAAQTISGEVEEQRVMERLLETAIMHAGARGGQLLLTAGTDTVVAATAERGDPGVTVTVHHPPLVPNAANVAESVVNYVTRTGRPLILDDARQRHPFAADPYLRRRSVRSLLGLPLLSQRELRGILCVENDLIPGVFTLERLTALEVIATQAVISLENAQARERWRAVADEQSRLHRLAELVARGAEPPVVFEAVCTETGQLIGARSVSLSRFTGTDSIEVVSSWNTIEHLRPQVGTRLRFGPGTATWLVATTGAPGRVDSYEPAPSELAAWARGRGIRCSVAAPIMIEGRPWGVLIAATDQPVPLPPDTEQRLARLTDLVATAISNASARADLIASRARIVAAGDNARRRIERNLHDGAQQQLIVLGLDLQALGGLIPPELADAHAELERIRSRTAAAFEQLRQMSRGLHPAELSQGGLPAALRVLARNSPIPVELVVECDPRPPEMIENCVYYVVSECLTNAAKYSGASHVSVEVHLANDSLQATIEDDGRGGADPAAGSGLIGLIDRVEALSGRLTLESPAARGTRITITLPVAQAQPRQPEPD